MKEEVLEESGTEKRIGLSNWRERPETAGVTLPLT